MPTSYAPVRAGSLVRLSAAVSLLATAGVVLAAPAAAMEDPRRPTATVTHGPSCGPAVVRTLVTNGTEPHTVTLLIDGIDVQSSPLTPGEQVQLVSPDVAWGQTVAVSVAVTAGDGTPEEPLDLDTYTRPSAEDCAAVTPPSPLPDPPPTSSEPPATPDVPATPTAPEPETTPPPTTAAPAPPTPGVPTPPGPGTPRPAEPATSAPGTATASGTPQPGSPPRSTGAGTPASTAGRGGTAASSSAAAVSPGGVVTVRATGFTAGEPVTVTLPGIDEPLTTVTAAADGSVETVVQIPRDTELGSTTVQFTGADSATTAGVDLDVAARDRVAPESTGSPAAVAAGLALVGAAGTLGVMGARRSRGRHADAER